MKFSLSFAMPLRCKTIMIMRPPTCLHIYHRGAEDVFWFILGCKEGLKCTGNENQKNKGCSCRKSSAANYSMHSVFVYDAIDDICN